MSARWRWRWTTPPRPATWRRDWTWICSARMRHGAWACLVRQFRWRAPALALCHPPVAGDDDGLGPDPVASPLRPCQLGAADHRPDHARQLQRHPPAALGPRHRHPDRLRPGGHLHQHHARSRCCCCSSCWRWASAMPMAWSPIASPPIGASISSLLLLHFVAPLVHPQFFERIVDTLIGAGLSWAFSYLLPSWESEDLPKHRARPAGGRCRLCRRRPEPDAGRARAIAWRARRPWMRWRNCRAPSAAWPTSPTSTAGRWRRWASLLGANYLLASDLSSMPVLVKLRAHELDAAAADGGHRPDPRAGGGDAQSRKARIMPRLRRRSATAWPACTPTWRWRCWRAGSAISNIPRRRWRGWRPGRSSKISDSARNFGRRPGARSDVD